MQHWFYRQIYQPKNNHRYILKSKTFSKRRRSLFLVVFLIIFIGFGIYLVKFLSTHQQSTQENSGKILGMTSFQLPNIDKLNRLPPKRISNTPKINIPAKSVVLIDADTKYPLYLKNERARVPIASLSKIMTALIALENYQLDDTVTITRQDINGTGSKIHLLNGEKISVHSLLYGLLIASGNDSAYALASLIPNSGDSRYHLFVEKMNKKATILGLKDTKFNDPAGLDDKGLSTAYDLAILTAYALQNPNFADIVMTVQKDITSINGKIVHKLKNSNRLIIPDESFYYQQAIGIKTGYTEGAGHCLIAAAKNNNHLLLSVILNTNYPSKSESARLSKELLQWGFNSFAWN